VSHAFALTVTHPGFTLDARASWDAPCAVLFGASGSGKTTILEAIAGARPDVTGTVTIAGRTLNDRRPEARLLGWVPQDASLFPHMTAEENVAFGIRFRGDGKAAAEAIDALEIGRVMSRRSRDLSGGERQRVAIARALASKPAFLLLDEPLASIDRPLRARVLPFLRRIPKDFGIPMLVVTHDPLEVLALANHVIVLESGKVVADGDPRAVFASARSFALLHALGAENVFAVVPEPGADASHGLLRVTTNRGTVLEMATVPGFSPPVQVAIRSEDIMLATEQPRGVSAQNVLEGWIERVEPLGAQVHVVVRMRGDVFRAKVTSKAREALGLAEGQRIFLLIKAHAIQPTA
jgi:molybdate transport system ATP-binding protein